MDTGDQGQRTLDWAETLLRFGVATKTELRLTTPDYFRGAGMNRGLATWSSGRSGNLAPARGSDVSLVVSLSMPTGAAPYGATVMIHSWKLPWSRALDANWTAAGMLSVYWPTQNDRRNVTGETTFLMERQSMKTWDAFVEYAGDFPESGGPLHLLHFGTSYRPRLKQQIDVDYGVGLSSATVDHFIGVGYSFRLHGVHR